ncbi:MAG: glutamyl-tRNA amidotransferase, partial [Candidatus Accumulibacter sp.]|nr:glutamyl-tRNA amidotransferase [Accumulibacter sp.]
SLYLARIAAYENRGPVIHAILGLDSGALAEARALDRERREKGRRSPLHGIPVVLKDNIDSVGLANTGGSLFLEGNRPQADAFAVARLRAAGAIILAKVNLGDFASDATGRSSLGGQTRNPHDPAYSPSGSSGGTGAALGAWFAPLGLGTDTGGSLRSPASVNGLAGLKPTTGLVSRGGVIPTCWSFDAVGPMARSVSDVALLLGAMTGVDAADPATLDSLGLAHGDYTRFLDRAALKGARLGVLRGPAPAEAGMDEVFEQALADLEAEGAVLVPTALPRHVLEARAALTQVVCDTEKELAMDRYLAPLPAELPRSMRELDARAADHLARHPEQAASFPKVYAQLAIRLRKPQPPDSRIYRSAREQGLTMMREAVRGVFETHRLDALVYLTRANLPDRIGHDPVYDVAALARLSAGSFRNVANLTGFPDLVVPAGRNRAGLPVSISFLGPAWSEPRLLALGYAYEQATRRRFNAAATPALPGENFEYFPGIVP